MTASSATGAQATTLESAPRPWWLTLIIGIVAFITGAILLWAPTKTAVDTYQLLVALLGLYWLIRGFMDIIYMFIDHRQWGWKLFMGIVGILAGWYILAYPVAAGVALPRIFVLVLGIWALMDGIILLIMAFRGGGWGAGILGALAIVLGLILIGDYGTLFSGISMVWAAAVTMLIGGAAMVVMAFVGRKA
jgi:uncharacterized membrane protein HdeD (DUF308 family)